MKKQLMKIMQNLKELTPVLKSDYHVETIEVFGSYVKNNFKQKSDLDILVTFSKTPGLIKFLELENYLSDKVGIKVDLVMKETLKPRLRKMILSNSVSI